MNQSLSVAALARRLGIAAATLRTWDRRYGLGPSEHKAGCHRRYSQSDVAKLTYMRRLVVSGIAPADAAVRAKEHDGSEAPVDKFLKNKSSAQGREELVASLFRAAQGLDSVFLESALIKEIKKYGAISTWHEVVVPLLVRIGETWERTEEGVEVEHVLSEILKRVFHSVEPKKAENSRPVLLAAIAEEQHSLALYALKAALVERGISVQFLGARTPLEAVAGIVKRIAPPAVFLWACMPENADPRFINNLPKVRPAPRIIIGGPGWNLTECEGAIFAPDIASACEEITQAVGVQYAR